MTWLRRALGLGAKHDTRFGPLELWRELFGGHAAKSGQQVTWRRALEATTVLACCRVLADGVAQVPFKVFRESGARREPARDHWAYDLLHARPNPWQTSFEYRETVMFHVVLAGNHYSFKNVVRGRVVELIPFEPQMVVPERAPDNTVVYRVTAPNGEQQTFPAEAIWHVRGPSWNGWMGLEAVRLAREAIGLALAAEEQHAQLHANGVQTSGLYSVEGTLSADQFKQLRAWIEANIGGENRHKALIVDRGAKWAPMGMKGVDAEHLDTRKFQIEEVCRPFRVMPIMVGHADKTATYASAEQMFLAHVVHTLMPWYTRLEQSADANILTAEDRRQGYYTKFLAQGLMRGAAKDRAQYYRTLWNIAALNANEIRGLEDMNPYEGGDAFRVPLNTADAQGGAPADGDEDDGDAATRV